MARLKNVRNLFTKETVQIMIMLETYIRNTVKTDSLSRRITKLKIPNNNILSVFLTKLWSISHRSGHGVRAH